MNNYIKIINSKALAFLFIMVTGLFLLFSQTAEAKQTIAAEKIKVIMVGDRLVFDSGQCAGHQRPGDL